MSECCVVSFLRGVLLLALPLAVGPLAAFGGRVEWGELRAIYAAIAGLILGAAVISCLYRAALRLGAARWKLLLLLPIVLVAATEITFQSHDRFAHRPQDTKNLAGFSMCVFLETLLVIHWLRIPPRERAAEESAAQR